jgi:sugar transferase (PEP-CTERM/EpsH1 system associated)
MDRRFSHAIICLDYSDEFQNRLQRDDVEIIALNKKPGKDLGHYGRMWRALRRLKPSVVHTRNIGTIEAGMVARAAGVRHVLHGEHGFDINDLHGAHSRYRRLRQFANPFVRRFVCVSQQIQHWLQRDVGLPEDKLVQIYNGVDIHKFSPVRQDARARLRELGVQSRCIIGSVGRLEAVKNQIELVRAFLNRCERSPAFAEDTALVLLGNGSQRELIEAQINNSEFGSGVHLLGKRDDVAKLLPGFDVFALPSLNEGISNTLLEAMACGVPVIASRVGGNAELFTDGRQGTLYESGDEEALSAALDRYFETPDMRTERAEAARKHVVEHFSLERMIEQYESLYAAYC